MKLDRFDWQVWGAIILAAILWIVVGILLVP